MSIQSVRRGFGSSGTVFMAQPPKGFFSLAAGDRKRLMKGLVGGGNELAIRSALSRPGEFLEGFSRKERVWFWERSIERFFLSYIAHHHAPTVRSAGEYLEATVKANDRKLRQPKLEHAAHLMACLKWDDITAAAKASPMFRSHAPGNRFSQGILSSLRNMVGERGPMSSSYICQAMERAFAASVKDKAAVLVNGNMLFKTAPDWHVALCLEDFVSSTGYVFFKGMYYFISGDAVRRKIIKQGTGRMAIENPVWSPAREARFDARTMSQMSSRVL